MRWGNVDLPAGHLDGFCVPSALECSQVNAGHLYPTGERVTQTNAV
jgi:hypothetical protein